MTTTVIFIGDHGLKPLSRSRHKSLRRNITERRKTWGKAARAARRMQPIAPFVPLPAMTPGLPLAYEPRFTSIFTTVQTEVNRVQRVVTVQRLRALCQVPIGEHGESLRAATDAEIAAEGAFTNEKQNAAMYGFECARAAARRLGRYYGIRGRTPT